MTAVVVSWTRLGNRHCVLLLCLLVTVTSCRSTPIPPGVEPAAQTAGEQAQRSDPAEPSAPSLSLPPPPPDNAYLAQLPPPVTGPLAALPTAAVVPSYLPAGMELIDYGIAQENSDDLLYWLIYGDDQDRCLAVESTTASINSSSLKNQVPLNLPLFGGGYSLHYGTVSDDGTAELFTDWLAGLDGFYRLIGAGLVEQRYGISCFNVTVEEATQITESLIYFSADINTLD